MNQAEMNGLFAQIKVQFDLHNRSGLVCKQGCYNGCCVLKLQKASWTNDPMHWIQNRSGIFFSVWTNQASLKNGRILYNIHALKLRELKGHTIASRDFARDFRERFENVREKWPNVQVDRGPATLMEGWVQTAPHPVEKKILHLMERFIHLSPMVDDLLQARQNRPDSGRR